MVEIIPLEAGLRLIALWDKKKIIAFRSAMMQ